jgi:chromatin segregation and condensation protein Rec8/ScpA/Scc1 (kleisin family)
VPISVYMDEVVGMLREAGGSVQFLDFFADERSRARVIGIFLALLELVRRNAIHVHDQGSVACLMLVALRADAPTLEPNGFAAEDGSTAEGAGDAE